MPDDKPALSTTQTVGVAYAGIGYVFGFAAGVVTFIGAWAYCVMTYGFVLGLGLGWFPAAICAGIVGWATVFLWGPALLIILALGGFAIVTVAHINMGFLPHVALGAGVGWLVWRFSPKSLSGRK
jgi:hypothetical protein